jgi:hypothetical protein
MNFWHLLAIVFITLKLTNIIAWSWWLVLLPLYGWFVVFIISAIILAAIAK